MAPQEHAIRMGEAVTMVTEQPASEARGSSAKDHAVRSLPSRLSRDTGCADAPEGLLHTDAVPLGHSQQSCFSKKIFSKRRPSYKDEL